MDRTDPPPAAAEPETLLAYLRWQRATVLQKAAGLSAEQLHTPHPPSSLTLGGLLKHLALVEDSWIQDRFLGHGLPEPWASAPFDDDPDWEFHSAPVDDGDDLRALYEAAAARTDAAIAGVSLDQLAVTPLKDGTVWSLRWLLLHLIEETARHAGHADLIREAIDGATGE